MAEDYLKAKTKAKDLKSMTRPLFFVLEAPRERGQNNPRRHNYWNQCTITEQKRSL